MLALAADEMCLEKRCSSLDGEHQSKTSCHVPWHFNALPVKISLIFFHANMLKDLFFSLLFLFRQKIHTLFVLEEKLSHQIAFPLTLKDGPNFRKASKTFDQIPELTFVILMISSIFLLSYPKNVLVYIQLISH